MLWQHVPTSTCTLRIMFFLSCREKVYREYTLVPLKRIAPCRDIYCLSPIFLPSPKFFEPYTDFNFIEQFSTIRENITLDFLKIRNLI